MFGMMREGGSKCGWMSALYKLLGLLVWVGSDSVLPSLFAGKDLRFGRCLSEGRWFATNFELRKEGNQVYYHGGKGRRIVIL